MVTDDGTAAPGGAGADNVEVLSGRHGPQGRPVLGQLEDHWRQLKARSAHLPRRGDVDAGLIAGALPHAFVAERAAPGLARLRIAGRALSGLLGGEARGLPLSLLFAPEARAAVQAWLDRCLDEPALIELSVSAGQGPFRAALGGRLLLLPMLDADDQPTRILGGLALDAEPRRQPLRLDLGAEPCRLERLPAPAAAWDVPPARAGGLAEGGRPYLRLVVSNG